MKNMIIGRGVDKEVFKMASCNKMADLLQRIL